MRITKIDLLTRLKTYPIKPIELGPREWESTKCLSPLVWSSHIHSQPPKTSSRKLPINNGERIPWIGLKRPNPKHLHPTIPSNSFINLHQIQYLFELAGPIFSNPFPQYQLKNMINSYKHNKPTLNPSSTPTTIKFLCSYGGKILPCYPDGKLRYQGGETRVLAVDRSISFSELIAKLGEMCGGTSVSLRCQLPTEDMDDALVSITSDEDLANLIEEYDRTSSAHSYIKVRAFLSTPKSIKKLSPTSSLASSSSSSSNNDAITSPKSSPKPPRGPPAKCIHHHSVSRPALGYGYPHHHHAPGAGKGLSHFSPVAKTSIPVYLIHHGNHWQ